MTDYDAEGPRVLGRAHPREGRGVRPRLLPAGVRALRPQPDARLHGVLRHAVALPALVVRQGLREAEDALRLRRLRPAVRDGDQLEPGARLPDARQLAAACRSSPSRTSTATTTSSRTTSPSRRTRAEFTIGTFKAHAHRVRRYVEDPSIGVDQVETILDAAHALSLQCRRNLAVRKLSPDEERAAAARRRRSRRPIRSGSIHRRAGVRRARSAQTCRSSPDEDLLLFIRDHNPYLTEWETRSAHHRPRGGAVLHPADRDQDHERGLGLVLAQAHPRPPRAAAGAAPRVPRAPQPGGAAASRAASTRTTSASASGRTSSAAATTRRPTSASAYRRARPGDDLLFETREVDRDVSFLRRYLHRAADARARPVPSTSHAATTW